MTIIRDFPINTERRAKAKRPNIIIKQNKDYVYILIRIDVPSDKNTSVKVFDLLIKYKCLELEI